MEELTKTLTYVRKGYGHFYITIEMNGKEFGVTTTNTMAIDAVFDDSYDEEDNSRRFYENQYDAQVSLVSEILTANDIEI